MRNWSRMMMLVAGLSLVTAACVSVTTPEIPGPSSSREIEIAPNFTVPTLEGEFSLAEHVASDGRPIFLNLWASWCFPCREEMPAIDRTADDYPGIVFIGVSVQDSRVEAEAFVEEIGVTYLIGFDEENAVNESYKPLGLPASYIISGEGVILERVFGMVDEEDLAEKFALHFGLEDARTP